jgi:hypothetical protein
MKKCPCSTFTLIAATCLTTLLLASCLNQTTPAPTGSMMKSSSVSAAIQDSEAVSSNSDVSQESGSIGSSTAPTLLPTATPTSKPASSAAPTNTPSATPYVKPLPPDTALEEKGVQLEIAATANRDRLNSFGAEWDPHFWMPYNAKYDVDTEDWNLITRRILEMGIDRVRVGWQPVYHEFMNDNSNPAVADPDLFFFNENNQELQSLKKQLDFCQKNGIKVTLAYWGPTRQSWIGSGYEGNWWNSPNSDDEYAENIAVLLKHLIVTCKYTVIDEFCSFNEPSLGYYNESGKIIFSEYAAMMRTLDTRLRKDGLRDKIRLVGSDDSSSRAGVGTGYLNGLPWFEDSVKNLEGIADLFSTHSYRFILRDRNEAFQTDLKMYYDTLKAHAPEAPLMVHEFGTANYADAYHVNDLETYERALLLPKFAINLLNAGGAGALYWILYDQLYYEGAEKDAKMTTGLWGFKTENWKIRKMYHSWGLVTKYTFPNSRIYAGQSPDSDLCIVALVDPKGFATYLIVNTGDSTKEFTIRTPVTTRAYFDRYIFDRSKATSRSDKLTGADGRIPCSRGVIVGEIGPESLLVLREA